MPEKPKSTPEEIPLHEVVLKIMYEANKEKPALLATNDVFWKITDASVNERNITEVLVWLVTQKRVERNSGKYSLDRFEFLDQRKADRQETGMGKGAAKASAGKDSKSDQEEIPLHDVVLKLMFEADREKPAELTVNDIFWKISDPSVQESQVGDVLKWLLHHRRVDNRAGKYSLDRVEFMDQTKLDSPVSNKKKDVKSTKPADKKTPKIIIPPAAEEKVIPKRTNTPKAPAKPKPAETKKVTNTPNPKETPATPKPKPVTPKPEETVVIDEKLEDKSKLNTVLLFIATGLFAFTCYLLISLSTSTTSVPSKKLQDEIALAQSKLEQLSEAQATSSKNFELVEKRLDLIQDITRKNSESLTIQNQNDATSKGLKSDIVNLFLSNSLILLILIVLFYRKNQVGSKRN